MVQWATILIRLLGYEEEGMTWPDSYSELAHDLQLTTGLPWEPRSNINRGEMAHMTAAAIEVERPDGSRIVDLLRQRVDDQPDHEVGELRVSLSAPFSVAEGGGRQVTITVTVVDGDNRPVPGANVSFNAGVHTFDRTHQLSPRETTTNSSGVAQTTYTTTQADDHSIIELAVAVSTDGLMEHERVMIPVSNTAAKVSGTVRDPATGHLVANLPVNLFNPDTERSITIHTDADGHYEIAIPGGNYYVWFEFEGDGRDCIVRNFTAGGSPYTLDYNKGIVTGRLTNFPAGVEVMAIGPDFDRHDPGNFTLISKVAADGTFEIQLFPGTYELFIMGRSSPFIDGVTVRSGEITDIGTISL